MRGGTTRAEPAGRSRPEQPTTMVATEVMLLWPRNVGTDTAEIDDAGLWPVFVLVVDERRHLLETSAKVLFDLLDAPKRSGEITLVSGRGSWSVVDPGHALLRLTLHAEAPVRFDSQILVPAERILGLLDVVARGATVGITTSGHVASLGPRVDVRAALRHVVLLGCPPAPELQDLTEDVFRARADLSRV